MAVVMEIQVVVQMMVRVVMDEEMKKTRKLKFYTEVKRSDSNSMSCRVMIGGDVFPVDIFLLQMVFIKSKSIRCCDVRVSRAHCWNSESIRHSTNTNAAHHSLLTFSFLFSLFSFRRFHLVPTPCMALFIEWPAYLFTHPPKIRIFCSVIY